MTFNSQTIIQEARADFEKMIDFVKGEEARTATADQIERGLFKMLLALGAKLLTVFFVMRSEDALDRRYKGKMVKSCPTIVTPGGSISRYLVRSSSFVRISIEKGSGDKFFSTPS